jgi:hydroxymethylbilane synthase
LEKLPDGLTIATSSTRRAAQLLELRPDFKIVQIRGNVVTRLEKLANQPEIDATILAVAGLARLRFQITSGGRLKGEGVPNGLLATILEPEEMLPSAGQAAIGIEIREQDERMDKICARLNDPNTLHCVVAERALLRAMGGGCQTPIGAYAEVRNKEISLQAVSFMGKQVKRAEARRPIAEAAQLGEQVAALLK